MEYMITVTESVDGRTFEFRSHFNSKSRARGYLSEWVHSGREFQAKVEII